jgi:hypothetical protein
MEVSSIGPFGRLRAGRLKELPAVRLEFSLSQGFAGLRRLSSPGSCERGFAGGFNAFAGDKRSQADRNHSPISALVSSSDRLLRNETAAVCADSPCIPWLRAARPGISLQTTDVQLKIASRIITRGTGNIVFMILPMLLRTVARSTTGRSALLSLGDSVAGSGCADRRIWNPLNHMLASRKPTSGGCKAA